MPSIPLSGPAVEPVTLGEAKAYLRVEHDADDDVIAALIAGARVHVEAQTRRALITQSWRLIRDAWPADGRVAVLPVPFRELIAARVYRFDGTTQAVETAGFIVEPASAPAVLSYINGAPPASSPAASSMSRWVTATRLQICRRICALCSESGARFTHWNCRCWSVPDSRSRFCMRCGQATMPASTGSLICRPF